MEKIKVLILYYSLGGGTGKLAVEVARGAEEVEGTEVEIKRIPEIIPEEAFEKDQKLKEIRDRGAEFQNQFPIATVDDLIQAHGVAFGTPVHFGSFASQVKQFIDQLSPAWVKGQLVNKPASVFCVSGSLHGGEELTLMSLIIPLLNLGMLPVGIPYPIQGEGPEFDGGSPYGAIYINKGKGLSEDDKKVARILGHRLAVMSHLLNCDCEKCNDCHSLVKKPH